MIKIEDAAILDILPFTFRTDENSALSMAAAVLTKLFYKTMSDVLFWSDIDNAGPAVLDAMAAETDAPFYSAEMTPENKRAVIAAAFTYNSKIGTPSNMTALMSAAFGGGEIIEWYDYNGKPYYFKLVVSSLPESALTDTGYTLLMNRLEKIKPKRAKMEDIKFTRSADLSLYFGGYAVKRYKKIVIGG